MDAVTSPVSISRHGSVAVVAIDHAPVNALSKGVRQGLLEAVRALEADPSVSALVISGGPRRFIAGADLREMALPPDEPFLPEVVAAIDGCTRPVVAAVDGAALGGGCEIALACDLRLGSSGALVGLTETKLGLIPGAGGTQRLARLVGVAQAIALVCEGRVLKAAEALALGLLDQVVEGDLLVAAIARAPQARKRRLSALAVPAGDAAEEEAASAAAQIAGDHRSVQGTDGDAGDDVREDSLFLQRLHYAAFEGAQGAALEDQRRLRRDVVEDEHLLVQALPARRQGPRDSGSGPRRRGSRPPDAPPRTGRAARRPSGRTARKTPRRGRRGRSRNPPPRWRRAR